MRPNNVPRKKIFMDTDEIRVMRNITIKAPVTFLWPFPMWPMNKERPFERQVVKTGDLAVC